MTENVIKIAIDDEFPAEEFWAGLDEMRPDVAQSLRETGVAFVMEDEWGDIKQIPGFSDGPLHAPRALMEITPD